MQTKRNRFRWRSVIIIDNYFGTQYYWIEYRQLQPAGSAACIISNNAARLSNYLLNIGQCATSHYLVCHWLFNPTGNFYVMMILLTYYLTNLFVFCFIYLVFSYLDERIYPKGLTSQLIQDVVIWDLTSLSKKKQKSNHLLTLKQREHFLLSGRFPQLRQPNTTTDNIYDLCLKLFKCFCLNGS